MNSDPITQPLRAAPARRLSDGFIVTLIMIVAAVTIAAIVYRLQSHRYEAPLAAAQSAAERPVIVPLPKAVDDAEVRDRAMLYAMVLPQSIHIAEFRDELEKLEARAGDAGLRQRISLAIEILDRARGKISTLEELERAFPLKGYHREVIAAQEAFAREMTPVRLSLAEWKP